MRPGKEIDLLLAIRAKARSAVLASYPTDTASGSPASFPDGADRVPMKSLVVSILPAQEGSGDPSPTNIRPISGWTGLTLSHSGADTSDPETLSISWQSQAGTVYKGTLNVTTGVLTVTHGLVEFTTGSYDEDAGRFSVSLPVKFRVGIPNTQLPDAICTAYKPVTRNSISSSGDMCFAITTTGSSMQIRDSRYNGETVEQWKAFLATLSFVMPLVTPATYQLTPTEVQTLYGENNLWADTGDVTAEYRADLEKYIEKKIGEGGTGTLSLGASPSMIRPGAGLQSQSLGLDDAEAEYLGELEDDAESYLDDLEDEYNEPKEEAEEELTEEPEEEPEETEASDEAGE